MKYLMINVVCGIRSTGRICTDLAEELECQGNDVKIAYGREEVPEQYQKYAVRIGNNMDVKLHALRARVFDDCCFGSKRATEKFIEWVKVWDPDVIHLHNIHGYYINIKVLFEYLKSLNGSKKIIWTLHDCWAFTGHCSHFTAVNCDKWKNGCYACPQKREYPQSLFFDRSKRNWEIKKQLFTEISNMSFVTPSNWLAELVKASFLSKYEVEVKHNTIDLAVFKPTFGDFRQQYNIMNMRIVLSVASAWSKKKGLDDLVQLSLLLPDEWIVVLVGLTKKQIRDVSRKSKRILGIERTNSARELAEIYTASDVFVNLTYEDTYPTVNLESQACGTPCITYRTGGSVESVPEENVVEQGDLQGLLRKLEWISKSK